MSLNAEKIRADFPILATETRGRPLTYLDSAASAQKPKAVIDAMADFYAAHYANIHRGVYQLSGEATVAGSGGRNVVRKCHVPSFCPKPEPGTITIPVSSSVASA